MDIRSMSVRLKLTQEILKTAMAQTTVEHFEIKEPTLNQIFIREVGESNE